MKPFTRKAVSKWLKSRPNCKGNISTGSAVMNEVPCLHSGNRALKGTSPPELIAAAHAGSFSTALADELGKAGYHADQIDTTATVTMENLSAGWTLTRIHLDVVATVAGMMQCNFIDAALLAKINCPISRLLGAKVSMRAKLNRRLPTRD